MCRYIDQPATIALKGDVVWVKLTETGDNGINTVLEFVMPRVAFTKSLAIAAGVQSAIDRQNAEAAIALLPRGRMPKRAG
jgi:hypothetical protein